MEKLEKYQYLGLMRSGTKAGMFTCLNARLTTKLAKQTTIVVHGTTFTSKGIQQVYTHIPNINYDAI